MKIIFSRKGFDSANGRIPSPILPAGTLQSLPIPSRKGDSIPYGSLQVKGISLEQLVKDLRSGRTCGGTAHLDPDLKAEMLPRLPGWRPLFGQAGAAQSHLERHRVGEGDLFLFFGWFRQTEWVNGRYRFVPKSPDIHLIFGWLQVGEKRLIGSQPCTEPDWLAYHHHCQGNGYKPNNTLYIASTELMLNGRAGSLPGGGAFPLYHPVLRLTAPDHSRSLWQLPSWFVPRNGRFPLSYHPKSNSWTMTPTHTLLHTAPIGQEFVLDTADYPEAVEWIRELIQKGTQMSTNG